MSSINASEAFSDVAYSNAAVLVAKKSKKAAEAYGQVILKPENPAFAVSDASGAAASVRGKGSVLDVAG